MDRTLPNVSAYAHPTSGKLVFVMRGQSGYWPADAVGIVAKDLDPDVWNEAHDITKGEAEAMFAGSMWGWEVPAADSRFYTKDGKPLLKRLLDD